MADSLPQSEKEFILNTRVQYMRVCLQARLSKMSVQTNILQLGTLIEN